jgi:hypothetical protein
MSGFFTKMTYDRIFEEEGTRVFSGSSMDAMMVGNSSNLSMEPLKVGLWMDQLYSLVHKEDQEIEILREAGKDPKQGIAEACLPKLCMRYQKSADDQTLTQTACYEDFWASMEDCKTIWVAYIEEGID